MFPTLSLLSAYAGRRLPLGCFVNARILRDHAKREAFAAAEQTRQALRYIAQNTQLSLRMRTKAMIDLAHMDPNTRPMKIKNRCIMGGKGRGVLRAFRVSRFQFRLNARAGNLPGVKKAIW
ncbi:40S ribosomal protein mrp2, mitochondrial [Maublancomyces gigas]|uniref:40S ribosomal protein mrp2, mitochondrial n=1 Tax=Discina gigas TaxID=1032678 RepID=A0ABR3GHV3_9PEZI